MIVIWSAAKAAFQRRPVKRCKYCKKRRVLLMKGRKWMKKITAAVLAAAIAVSLSGTGFLSKTVAYAAEEGFEVFVICAQIEQEIAELEEDEKTMFLEDLGLKESGLDKLIAASYRLLGLISFLTAGEDECRAWTIRVGTKAPQAAGKIHTDFERGFIRAEVVNYKDLLENGSLAAARDKGLVGLEGKEYVVKDGDVILFRFNV